MDTWWFGDGLPLLSQLSIAIIPVAVALIFIVEYECMLLPNGHSENALPDIDPGIFFFAVEGLAPSGEVKAFWRGDAFLNGWSEWWLMYLRVAAIYF